MNGDDIAVLREDIKSIDDKVNKTSQRVAVIEERLNNDNNNRVERQKNLDERLDKMGGGIDIIISRNKSVDDWFVLTKKIAGFITAIVAAIAAVLAFLKFIIKTI